MKGLVSFGTGAMALTAVSFFPMATTSEAFNNNKTELYFEREIQLYTTENNNSSTYEFTNIQTQVYNWHNFAYGLLGESREFNEQESIAHANALESISVKKGKRFDL